MWANLQAGASIANNLAGGTANQIPVQTGVSQTGFIDAPTVANTFLEWSGSAFQWSTNPLGTVTSIDVSGGTTGLTYSGGPITTSGTITMAGTLITTNGGTGLSSYTAGDISYYVSGTALSKLAIGSSTFILTSTGTAPQWSDPAGISVNTATNIAGGGANQIVFNTASGTTSFITAPTVASTYLRVVRKRLPMVYQSLGTVTSVDVSGGTTGLTTSGGPVTTSGTITLAGTLAVANGGTGQTSYINGELLIGNTTGNTLTKATLTAGTGITHHQRYRLDHDRRHQQRHRNLGRRLRWHNGAELLGRSYYDLRNIDARRHIDYLQRWYRANELYRRRYCLLRHGNGAFSVSHWFKHLHSYLNRNRSPVV
jgi:hypothetical protein